LVWCYPPPARFPAHDAAGATAGLLLFQFALHPEAFARPANDVNPEAGKPGPRHEHVRGADHYDPPTALLQ